MSKQREQKRDFRRDAALFRTTIDSAGANVGSNDATVLIANKFREVKRTVVSPRAKAEVKKPRRAQAVKKAMPRRPSVAKHHRLPSNQQKHKAAGQRTLRMIKLNAQKRQMARARQKRRSILSLILMLMLMGASGFLTYHVASAWFQHRSINEITVTPADLHGHRASGVPRL